MTKPCAICGELFETRWEKVETCSKACGYRLRARNKRAFHQAQREAGTEREIRAPGGYRYVYRPEHPAAHKKTGYVLEHRWVMEQSLGRLLGPRERVHHKNGKRHDNRLENLELWRLKGKDPAGVRADDYHCHGCQCYSPMPAVWVAGRHLVPYFRADHLRLS